MICCDDNHITFQMLYVLSHYLLSLLYINIDELKTELVILIMICQIGGTVLCFLIVAFTIPNLYIFCSCGACGYELNLSSSNRNTTSIGSKYGKSIKRGIIPFFNIDDSRFTQVDEIKCVPHFHKRSWGLFRRRTKLLCRKCGNHIGNAYDGYTSSSPLVSNGAESPPSSKAANSVKYDIRLRSLQPSSSDESGTPVLARNAW
jgi:hypothetical protein